MKTTTINPPVLGGKKCKCCGEPLGQARENKTFCSSACRAKHHRLQAAETERENQIRQQVIESIQLDGIATAEDNAASEAEAAETARLEGIMAEIGKEVQAIEKLEQEIAEAEAKRVADVRDLPEAITKANAEIERLEGLQWLDEVEFYNRYLNEELARLVTEAKSGSKSMDYMDVIFPNAYRQALVKAIPPHGPLRAKLAEGQANLQRTIAQASERRKALERQLQSARTKGGLSSWMNENRNALIESAKARIKGLERKLQEPPKPPTPPPLPEPLPILYKQGHVPREGSAEPVETQMVLGRTIQPQQPVTFAEPKKPKVPKGEIGGADLLAESSESFLLQGALGAFIGRLDRKMVAIGLTGDSGSGKSTFSLTLALRFARHGFTVKYFSLEEGLGDSMKDKIWAAGIGNEVKFHEGATLQAIRQDAKRFDVIFIDSFTVLEGGQDELEKLRKDFPETIFVCIHQKTTAGTIRGGSKIFYNSTAIINIEIDHDRGRLAVMQKSRYGTVGFMYNIGDDEVFRAGDW